MSKNRHGRVQDSVSTRQCHPPKQAVWGQNKDNIKIMQTT